MNEIMKLKPTIIKVLAICFSGCILAAMLLGYDVIRERNFVYQAVLLAGENENEIENRFHRKFTQTNNVFNIHRRRVVPYFWRLLGKDESVSVYVVVSEGKIGQCIFAVWFPSMQTIDYTR